MYDYVTQRPSLFTESGVETLMRMFRKIVDKPGLFRSSEVMTNGDSWTMIAALDYLEEKGIVRKVARGAVGQDDVWEAIRAR